MANNFAISLILPVIGLLILILGPAIRNKMKHEQKEKVFDPSKYHSLLEFSRNDSHYRITAYSAAMPNVEPLGDIGKMIDTDE